MASLNGYDAASSPWLIEFLKREGIGQGGSSGISSDFIIREVNGSNLSRDTGYTA
jgi:hypothetical protein